MTFIMLVTSEVRAIDIYHVGDFTEVRTIDIYHVGDFTEVRIIDIYHVGDFTEVRTIDIYHVGDFTEVRTIDIDHVGDFTTEVRAIDMYQAWWPLCHGSDRSEWGSPWTVLFIIYLN